MTFFSISELSTQRNISRKTIKSALQRGKLKGIKNSDGMWLIDEKDAEEYFREPPFPEWISFQEISRELNIPVFEFYRLRDHCDFPTRTFKGNIYAQTKELKITLVSVGLLRTFDCKPSSNENLQKSTITIRNKKGIHLRPSLAISRVSKEYLPSSKLKITYGTDIWMYSDAGSVAKLLAWELHPGTQLKLETWGCYSKQLMSSIANECQKNYD